MQQYSTVNLHNIQQDIYLGFLAQEPIRPTYDDLELSFFGGDPLWLYPPSLSSSQCDQCHTKLTFLGQIYCPFEAEYCFHRILYILWCQKCLHSFKCIRQQATSEWKYDQQKMSTELKSSGVQVKILSRNAYEIENDNLNKKQLNSLMNKAKIEVEEEKAIEEADSEEEEDLNQQEIMVPNIEQSPNKNNQHEQEPLEQSKQIQDSDSSIDMTFEQYKKIMKQLDNPCMLYTNIPVLYNQQPVNPKHFCQKCGGKLELQVQLTEQVLLMNNKECSERLLLMDWGSIFVYTCSNSCIESQEEELVVQYEIDPINEESIKKLKKKKKNRKRSQQKMKNKSQSKPKEKSQEKQQNEKTQGQQSEGDWD